MKNTMPGIRRLTEIGTGVGVVYFEKSQEEVVAYCHRCLEMGNVRSKLGNRIYLPDEFGRTVIPPDADQWRQCHLCGSIYARYEVKQVVLSLSKCLLLRLTYFAMPE
jgi:hypothetical protein